MEDFIVSDLLRLNGVINAVLLDSEGFTLSIANSDVEISKDIAKVADIDVQDKGYSRITITLLRYHIETMVLKIVVNHMSSLELL